MRASILGGLALVLGCCSLVQAAERFKKEFPIEEKASVSVDADVGRIKVERGMEGKVTAYVELPQSRRFRLQSEQDADRVRIYLEHTGLFRWFFFPFDWAYGDEVLMRLEVPHRCDLDLETDAGDIEISGDLRGNVRLRTTAGSIWVRDLKGEVGANAASGRVKVEDFSGNLDVETSTGGVWVYDSQGEFYLETSAGTVQMERVSGTFKVRSSLGSIYFDGSVSRGVDNYLKTSVGSIRAMLRNPADIEIDAETDVGSVNIFPGIEPEVRNERYLRVRIGEGSQRLRLRSETGSIRIERWDILEEEAGEQSRTGDTTDEKPESEQVE